MRRFGRGLLFGMGGYLLGAVAGYLLINQFSSNSHDRALEAAMTGAFVAGPLAAVVAFVIGFATSRRSRPAA